jgi:hypothetical protein
VNLSTHTQKNDLVVLSINVQTRSNARCYLIRQALFRCEVERVQRAVSSQHCDRHSVSSAVTMQPFQNTVPGADSNKGHENTEQVAIILWYCRLRLLPNPLIRVVGCGRSCSAAQKDRQAISAAQKDRQPSLLRRGVCPAQTTPRRFLFFVFNR